MLVTNTDGAAIGRNDSILINSTTWKQASGETMASTKARGQPLPFSLANQPVAFTELMQLLRKGEKAVVWVPPGVPFRAAAQLPVETMVYEIEIVDVTPAPAIPRDLAGPPAKAPAFKSGIKYEIVRPAPALTRRARGTRSRSTTRRGPATAACSIRPRRTSAPRPRRRFANRR